MMGIMKLLDNNRISHWFAGAVIGWTASLIVYVPIFHWGLGFSIAKIAVSVGIFCIGQLAVTPWLFSARATTENPTGKKAERSVAAIVWFSFSALLFFYYIGRGWPNDAHETEFRGIMFGTTIVFGIAGLIIVRLVSRNRGRS
jgi:hypothetical protein